MKNFNIDKVIVDTVRNDADMIFSKMTDLDNINRHKYEMMKNLTTTEVINNIDLMTLYEVASVLQIGVNLPNQAIKGSYIIVEFIWGTVVLLANMTEN